MYVDRWVDGVLTTRLVVVHCLLFGVEYWWLKLEALVLGSSYYWLRCSVEECHNYYTHHDFICGGKAAYL